MGDTIVICGHKYIKGENNVYVAIEEFHVNVHNFTLSDDMAGRNALLIGKTENTCDFPKYICENDDPNPNTLYYMSIGLEDQGWFTHHCRGDESRGISIIGDCSYDTRTRQQERLQGRFS